MPLGKEVKVMQCWRCKAYGHRTGDIECPMRNQNVVLDAERQAREDPMSAFIVVKEGDRRKKYERVEYLMQVLEEIRSEERERKALKRSRRSDSIDSDSTSSSDSSVKAKKKKKKKSKHKKEKEDKGKHKKSKKSRR